jgi:serine phosphatase RsbU (regulator of sigma subunit)
VSGHGVPAGLVMMMVQTAIRSVLKAFPLAPPATILTLVNTVIHENIQKMGEDKYMSITLMSVQPDGRIYYSGLHQDLLIYRQQTNSVEVLETKGMWLGINDDIRSMITVDTLTLATNDTMLLYTDGITEAVDTDNAMFSEEQLKILFEKIGDKNPDEIKTCILNALKGHTLNDDVTLVVIKKK